jgi:hypothetical protein
MVERLADEQRDGQVQGLPSDPTGHGHTDVAPLTSEGLSHDRSSLAP